MLQIHSNGMIMFNQFACQIVLIHNELVIQSRVSKKRTTDVLFSLVRASVKPWLASNFGNGVLEEFEVIPTDADYCRNFPNFDRDLQICGREQDSSSDLGSLCSSQAGTPLICPGIGRNGEDGHFSPVLVGIFGDETCSLKLNGQVFSGRFMIMAHDSWDFFIGLDFGQ